MKAVLLIKIIPETPACVIIFTFPRLWKIMDKEILIIGNDESTVQRLKECVKGFKIISRSRLSPSGLNAIKPEGQIVLLDLPEGAFIAGVKEIRTYYPQALIIAIQVESKKQSSITAMKEGAYACIEKPMDEEILRLTLKSAEMHLALMEEIQRLKALGLVSYTIVGKSPEMLSVIRKIQKVSEKNAPVIVSGEDGTGRQLVARAIHNQSLRRGGPFITLSVSEEDRLEEKVKSAEGGTLFINGVEGFDKDLLRKLFMLVDKGRFPTSEETPKANVMVIASSKGKDLDWTEIKVPALRNRRQDILPLAKHFLKEAEAMFETGKKRFSKELEDFLLSYDWPGNVKELKTAIRKACIISKEEVIGKHDLLGEGIGTIKEFLEAKLNRYINEVGGVNKSNLYDTVVSEVQKSLIEIALKKTNGNKLQAAKLLDISRNTLGSKTKVSRRAVRLRRDS
ncbi:MAG: sigma-54-dependent Fis family transcriptional regulator [Nitrospirae bacterium]|nr:sigma-54-dependent Fis family transcriptional regulator [Nitrospirota bacterium]